MKSDLKALQNFCKWFNIHYSHILWFRETMAGRRSLASTIANMKFAIDKYNDRPASYGPYVILMDDCEKIAKKLLEYVKI